MLKLIVVLRAAPLFADTTILVEADPVVPLDPLSDTQDAAGVAVQAQPDGANTSIGNEPPAGYAVMDELVSATRQVALFGEIFVTKTSNPP